MEHNCTVRSVRERTAIIAYTAFLASLAIAQPASAERRASVLDLLPKSTQAILSIDLRALGRAPHYRTLRKALLQQEDIAEAVKELRAAGIELERDVHRISLAAPNGFRAPEEFLVFVEGRKLMPKLVELSVRSKAKRAHRSHAGVAYYELEAAAMAEIEGLVVLASESRLRKLIDHIGEPSLGKSRSVAALMGRVSGHQAWLLMRPEEKSTRAMGLPELETVALGATLHSGFTAELMTRHGSEAAAIKASTLVGMMKTVVANDESLKTLGLSGALRSANVSQKGRVVTAKIALTKAELGQLGPALRAMLPSL